MAWAAARASLRELVGSRPSANDAPMHRLVGLYPDTAQSAHAHENALQAARLGFDRRVSFGRCAIVGSSGALLHDRRGAEIDSHDFVVRFNNAPVEGYEAVVGARTDLRLFNTHVTAAAVQRCATFSSNGTCAPVRRARACCPKVKVLLNSGRDRIARCYRAACGGASESGQANVLTALAEHPLIRAFKASLPSGHSVLSGVYAIAVAQLLCTRRINVYGFTSSAKRRENRSDDASAPPSYPYHYYDSVSQQGFELWSTVCPR